MKKALIIYNSKTGTTKKYAEQIGEYISLKDIQTNVISIEEHSEELYENVDYILFGCCTHGLMFFLQHPEKLWKKYAQKVPEIQNAKVGIFATYKILTGSMFKNMHKELNGKISNDYVSLKSKDGLLSDRDKLILEELTI